MEVILEEKLKKMEVILEEKGGYFRGSGSYFRVI